MSPEQEEIRGNEADRLMRDPLLTEAFSKTEEAIVQRLKTCPVGDRELQHELILTLQLLGRVHGYIKTVSDTGKMAKIQKMQKSFADRMLRRA
jgi:hypothetical protein